VNQSFDLSNDSSTERTLESVSKVSTSVFAKDSLVCQTYMLARKLLNEAKVNIIMCARRTMQHMSPQRRAAALFDG
jgi:hypothetical protein